MTRNRLDTVSTEQTTTPAGNPVSVTVTGDDVIGYRVQADGLDNIGRTEATVVVQVIAAVLQREADMLATGRRIEQFRLRPADWDAVVAAMDVARSSPVDNPRPPFVPRVGLGLSPDPMLLGYLLVVDPDAPPLSAPADRPAS